ncbi:DUF5412 family protein [Alkalihalobacterium alkalicellulosilyticum]|uniref:DUF5412 family protein n=1 Tax=Alkalihalobacterium alkalicellulosilyticum TaxID=1912214 RepID=UPI000995F968|nr:DUF5412 family protein [Bacillus alkalicellulosilyticus]
MKKRLIWVALFLIIGIAIYDFLNVELDEVSTGDFLSKHPSPYNDYAAIAYIVDEGGATVRAAVRVEIDYGDEIKTIYWNYDESTVKIKWLDKETIEINDHTLNIFTDSYHWKKDPNWEENRGRY